jgi:hypothetical protein
MTHIQFFWCLLVVSCGYALAKGGATERLTSVAFLIATILTLICYRASVRPWAAIDWSMLAIDGLLWVALLYIALKSDRYWPLWMASFQSAAILCHFTRIIPNLFGMAYAVSLQIWCYIMLPLLIIGTARHRRRLRISAVDTSWPDRVGAH